MTRIITGRARGARLDVPRTGTRPTSDRVRESLFGALESMDAIHGTRVLDLYAGSGALGLEAWSRGAERIDLVEMSRPAATVIARNISTVGKAMQQPGAAKVHQSSVRGYLARVAGPYDLVIIDPPYDLSDDALNGDLLALAPLLSPDAVVVVERGKRAGAPDFTAAGLEPLREKIYGDTAVWWTQPQSAPSQSR